MKAKYKLTRCFSVLSVLRTFVFNQKAELVDRSFADSCLGEHFHPANKASFVGEGFNNSAKRPGIAMRLRCDQNDITNGQVPLWVHPLLFKLQKGKVFPTPSLPEDVRSNIVLASIDDATENLLS